MLSPPRSLGDEPKVISIGPPVFTNLFYVRREIDIGSSLVRQERRWVLNGDFRELEDAVIHTDTVVSLDQITEEQWLKAEASSEAIHSSNGTFFRTRGPSGWVEQVVAVTNSPGIGGAQPARLGTGLRNVTANAPDPSPHVPVFDMDVLKKNPDVVWSRGNVSWKSPNQPNEPFVVWELEFDPQTRLKTRERVWLNGRLIQEERWQTNVVADSMQFEVSDTAADNWRKPMPLHVFHAPGKPLAGIGVILGQLKSGPFSVMAVMESSPAQDAGIQAGDVITRINGVSLEGVPTRPFILLCRGQEGTLVTLEVERRSTGEHRRVEIRRAELSIDHPAPKKIIIN